jgi:hypothetical protein
MNSLIMELSGNEDIETVRRLATDFMASYLVSPPAISQRQDGSVSVIKTFGTPEPVF